MTVTMVPTSTATMNVRGSSVTPLVAVEPNTDSSALGDEDAHAESENRRDEAGDRGLHEHRCHDLRARCAQGAQQCQLTSSLRHQDVERVDDQEAADEQRDEREDEQRRADEGADR